MKIVDHLWRPVAAGDVSGPAGPAVDRPCRYLNCRRPRAEHQRAVVLHPTALS